MIREAIQQLLDGQSLSTEQAEGVMDEVMTGAATPAQIAGFLVALRVKGETVDEITGCARAMRRAAVTVSPKDHNLVDTCGTGGDRAGTFNISTTTAFVAAGAGLSVAKHGNRSVSSQSGSADVLEALGVNLDLTPDQIAQSIDEVGIGFLYAPKMHPAMRYAIGPRRELGVRTIFNILGPLTNPAGASAQLLGVYDPSLTETLAQVLRELGTRAAYVVHGGSAPLASTLRENPWSPRRSTRPIWVLPAQKRLTCGEGTRTRTRASRRTCSQVRTAARNATSCCSTPPPSSRWEARRAVCRKAWPWQQRASTAALPAPSWKK
jgi:anthranilate phosphoribosyltransferase